MKIYPRSSAPAGASIAEVGTCVLERGIADLAESVLALASTELVLGAVARSIRWWVFDPGQTLRGNDCIKGYAAWPGPAHELREIRGFTDSTLGEHVVLWVRLEDDPYQVAMVVAHEARHSWQARETGGGPVDAGDRARREADAQTYAANFLTRMDIKPSPGSAKQDRQQAWRRVTQFAG